MDLGQILVLFATMLLSAAIFITVKSISKKLILRDIMSHDMESEALKGFRRIWFYIGWFIIGSWAILITIYLLFFSYNFQEELPSMNEEAAVVEAMENIQATKEEVNASNDKIIVDEESARQKKIDEQKDIAREEFNKMLKESGPE